MATRDLVYSVIIKFGEKPYSNQNLVDETGLTKQTINHWLNVFEREGLIERDKLEPTFRRTLADANQRYIQERLQVKERTTVRPAQRVIENLEEFHASVEFCVLARSFGLPHQEYREFVRYHLKQYILELENELRYLNQKQYKPTKRNLQRLAHIDRARWGNAVTKEFEQKLKALLDDRHILLMPEKTIRGLWEKGKRAAPVAEPEPIDSTTESKFEGLVWKDMLKPDNMGNTKMLVNEANEIFCPWCGEQLKEAYAHCPNEGEPPYIPYGDKIARPWLKK